MTTTVAVLLEAAFATPTGVIYSSEGCITAIDKLTATNDSEAIATITAQLISPDGAQIVSYKKALQPGATWPFPELVGHTLAAGGKLSAICPDADAIVVRASGRQFT
jgi:hypothetical protein